MNDKFKELSEQLREELKTKQQYDAGDLAMTSNDLMDLHTRIHDLEKRRLAACSHDEVEGRKESSYSTDEYGSGHTTYYVRLYCTECDQCLLEKWDARDYFSNWNTSYGPVTLQEGCIWFDKQGGAYSSRNGKTNEDYGVRRVERRVVEYVNNDYKSILS
jgi:hypothetical protein